NPSTLERSNDGTSTVATTSPHKTRPAADDRGIVSQSGGANVSASWNRRSASSRLMTLRNCSCRAPGGGWWSSLSGGTESLISSAGQQGESLVDSRRDAGRPGNQTGPMAASS